MAKEKKKRKKLLQKLLNRYRLVVINETTFEEESFFRLSRLNVIIAAIMLFRFCGRLALACGQNSTSTGCSGSLDLVWKMRL